ncbi:MAG: hypothetical protein AAB874_04440 [Patescibacteria group bacterium]
MNKSSRFLIRRYKDYFFPALSLGLITLLSLFVFIPELKQLIDSYQQVGIRNDQLARLTSKRRLLESISSNATTIYLAEADKALPADKDAASILVSAQNLAQVSGLSLDGVDLSPGLISSASGEAVIKPGRVTPVSKRGVAALLPVALKLRGTSAQLIEFLKQIENTRRLIDITSVEVSYAVDTVDFMTASFAVNVYYLPQISQIGGVDAELPQITPQEQALLAGLSNMPHLSKVLIEEPAPQEEDASLKKSLF